MRVTIRTWIVAFAVVLGLCINGWGCGWPPPPGHYSIDSEFQPAERETIRAVYDSWCDKVGYCPAETLWAERGRVALVDDLEEDEQTQEDCPEGITCMTSGGNTGDVIMVARNRSRPDDLALLWVIVAHEVGHYCQEHQKSGLMAAAQMFDAPAEIDQVAIDGWFDGCP